MPRLRSSFIELDPSRYQRIEPSSGPIPQSFHPAPAPEPNAIRRSTVMISSLPIISTNVDGVMRQFYGGPNFPMRRLVGA